MLDSTEKSREVVTKSSKVANMLKLGPMEIQD